MGLNTETGGITEPGGCNGDPVLKRTRIAAKARQNPKERFNNLLHHLTPELVMECLLKTPKSSSPGVDGMSVEEVKANLSWLLPPVLKAIHEGRYEAPAVRRVYIPKADGRKRPLGIPTVLDRAIQAAVAEILNQIYEQDFLSCSFGFRPGRGCHNALATLGMLVDRRKTLKVLEVDIRDFFGTINHGWLMKFLEHRISDKRVLKLVESWLKAGVMESGRWQETMEGTPQGGSISPLLANIYLHYVLDLWWEKKIKRQMKGNAYLIRYCDDFVVLCQNAEDMDTTLQLLKCRLSQFGLRMAEEKTHKTDLASKGQGKTEHGRRQVEFLGFSIYRTLNRRKTGYKIVYQTQSKRFSRFKKAVRKKLNIIRHKGLEDQARYLAVALTGHFNYYGLPGNSERLKDIWNEIRKAWKYWLSRRSQRGGLSWKAMQEKVFSRYPLPYPRIRISYQVLESYAIAL